MSRNVWNKIRSFSSKQFDWWFRKPEIARESRFHWIYPPLTNRDHNGNAVSMKLSIRCKTGHHLFTKQISYFPFITKLLPSNKLHFNLFEFILLHTHNIGGFFFFLGTARDGWIWMWRKNFLIVCMKTFVGLFRYFQLKLCNVFAKNYTCFISANVSVSVCVSVCRRGK